MKDFKFQLSNFHSLLLIAIAMSLTLFSGKAFAALTIKANHDHITVDFFYHGSTVSVSGISDPGADIVIKITSPEGHQTLKQKGKVAGLLWMNTGTLKLEKVPSLYFLSSTKKISDILNEEDTARHVLGYQALEKHMEMRPVADAAEKAKWFAEFVKFKEHSRLFSALSGKISFSQRDGKQNYYTLMDWPYQAPPGTYTVTVYAVKDKKVVETAQANVQVQQVGIIKTLAGMAKDSGALYGVISILAALSAGFGVGMIFRKGGGAH